MSTALPPSPLRPQHAFQHRVRFISTAVLVLLLSGWLLWFWPYDDLLDRSGTPLGADFSMFYVAGEMFAAGELDQLYDPAAQQARLHRLLPGIDPQFALPYRYPPLVAMLMSPLARLPYALAVFVFMSLGLVSAICGWRLLAGDTNRASPADARLYGWALLGWPVVLETWIGGQASLFALLIVCAGIVLMRRERYAWAGAVWALAAYKPNVLLLVVIGCVLFRPRVLRGLLPVGVLLCGLTWWAAGWQGILTYLELTLQLAAGPWNLETPFWKVHGLASWLTPVAGSQARGISLMLGLLATFGVVWQWRRAGAAADSPLPYALLITINALANPYTPIYDLTLLSAGMILMAPTLSMTGRYPLSRYPVAWQAGLAALYFGPHLSQAVAKSTGLQFFPLLLLAYAIFQARLFWKETGQRDASTRPERVAGEPGDAALAHR